jgi:hypothetical protein
MLAKQKKIIYLAFAPLTERIAREWYVDFLVENGHAVEFWNLAPFLDGIEGGHGLKDAQYARSFFSYAEFKKSISAPENRGAICVMLMGYGERFIPIYRLASQNGFRMIFLAVAYQPEAAVQIWKRRALLLQAPRKFVTRIFHRLKAALYMRLGVVRPYDVVFSPSPKIAATRFHAKKIVPVNSINYDRYIEAMRAPDLGVPKPYAVFLDIFHPSQSDLTFLKVQSVEPERYYASLNRFFDVLERKYDVSVVIAAHPKAHYSPDRYGGRAIYYGQSPALVKNCEFVISHHSTSIGFAVLARKPAIFVYTQQMLDLYRHQQVSDITDMATYLESPVYNVDLIESPQQIKLPQVNSARYEAYKYEFLTTPESEQMTAQDVFYKEIKSLLAEGAGS